MSYNFFVAFVLNFCCLSDVASILFLPPVSGSNLASHIVGSLKKGKSLTPIPPTAYNTLPSHVHQAARATQHHLSESGGGGTPTLSIPSVHHKRSPSTDSGNAGSRSTTPVSYRLGKTRTKILKGTGTRDSH